VDKTKGCLAIRYDWGMSPPRFFARKICVMSRIRESWAGGISVEPIHVRTPHIRFSLRREPHQRRRDFVASARHHANDEAEPRAWEDAAAGGADEAWRRILIVEQGQAGQYAELSNSEDSAEIANNSTTR